MRSARKSRISEGSGVPCAAVCWELPWAAIGSAVEELGAGLLHGSRGCEGALPLEAACAAGTAARQLLRLPGRFGLFVRPSAQSGAGGWELVQ